MTHLLCILIAGIADGYHHHLSRAEPQRPFTSIVLCQDGKHALHTTQYRSMYNDGALKGAFRGIGEVEPDG